MAVPTILSTGLLEVSSRGATGETGSATSSASVANVNVLTGFLTATVIRSTCTSNSAGSTGSSTLVGAGIHVPGQPDIPLAVNPAPNTTLSIAGITVVLNEQQVSNAPGSSSITVNAVHISLSGLVGSGDIIISQSHCDVAGPNVSTTTTMSSSSSSSSSSSTTSTARATTTTTKAKRGNAGRGNGSELVNTRDCDPGNSGGPNQGGD